MLARSDSGSEAPGSDLGGLRLAGQWCWLPESQLLATTKGDREARRRGNNVGWCRLRGSGQGAGVRPTEVRRGAALQVAATGKWWRLRSGVLPERQIGRLLRGSGVGLLEVLGDVLWPWLGCGVLRVRSSARGFARRADTVIAPECYRQAATGVCSWRSPEWWPGDEMARSGVMR